MADNTPSFEELTGQRSGNQLQFFLNAASRHWPKVFLFAFIGAAGYGLWGYFQFQQPLLYRAVTTLGVKPTMWDMPYLEQVQTPKIIELTPEKLRRRLLDDRTWAEDVARVLIQEDLPQGRAEAWVTSPEDFQARAAAIAAATSFNIRDPRSDTLEIAVETRSQNEARRIADATARVIIERNRQYILESERDTHAFLQDQVVEVRQRLDEAESIEWEFRKDMGFRTHEQVLEDMERINRQLVAAETQKAEIWAKMEEIESELQQKDAALPTALGRITDSVVTSLQNELNDLLQEKLEMSIIYTPAYPGLQTIEDQIEEKRQAILIALDRLDTSVDGGVDTWQELIDHRQEYRRLQLELSALDIRTKTMKRLLNELVEKLPQLADKSFEHQRLMREKSLLATQFDRLFDKLLEVRTATQRGSNQIERRSDVNVALAQSNAGRMRTWFNVLIGALVGAVVGLGLGMFLEASDRSIRHPEDVTEYLEMDLIGTIPSMQFGVAPGRERGKRFGVQVDEEQVDASIVTKHDPKSPISEAYRALRTKFQFASIKNRPRTVMVTSSVPGEGKTTTAVNMAVTMADSGMRVLIMDTDLRRPNVHRVLKMNRGQGLADVLREGLDVRSVLRPTRVENLWMISSGRVPPNPSELIGSERMSRVMAQLGNSFDIVICDAPSILVVTDPVLLTKQVDTTLMVVASEYASRDTILRAKELLATAESHVTGVVLNALKATRRNYYYYYYYYDDRSLGQPKGWFGLLGR